MKKICLYCCIVGTFAFAEYKVEYNGIEVGKVENFDTLKDSYVKANPTSWLSKMYLGNRNLIIYDEQFSLSKDETKNKYKKERSSLIDLLKNIYSGKIKPGTIKINKDKKIVLKKEGNKYYYEFVRKGKDKVGGFFETKNKELIQLVENTNGIVITKVR